MTPEFKIRFKDVRDRILGLRDFANEQEIKQWIRHSKNWNKPSKFVSSEEISSGKKSLLLFDSEKRHSWLVATNKRLYKILDDRREKSPKIYWSVELEQLRKRKDKIKIKFRIITARINENRNVIN